MNPHPDFAAEEAAILDAFDEACDLHVTFVRLEGEKLVQKAALLDEGIKRSKGKTALDRKVNAARLSAQAEAEFNEAAAGRQRALEIIRMRRTQLSLLQTKMANHREEAGGVMRDGAYRGA